MRETLFFFAGDQKEGAEEKNKRPERKGTMTTSKKEGQNNKKQPKSKHPKRQMVRAG